MRSSHLGFSVPSSERYLPDLRRRLRAFCREIPGASFDARDLSDLELALQEACVNAIRHARPASSAPSLAVSFSAGGGQLTIEVRDEGEGFDLDEVPDPDVARLRDSGYGLFIMRRTVDRVSARRGEDGFRLRLTKLYPGNSTRSGERGR